MGNRGGPPLQGLSPIVTHSPGRCPGLLRIGPTARGGYRVVIGFGYRAGSASLRAEGPFFFSPGQGPGNRVIKEFEP